MAMTMTRPSGVIRKPTAYPQLGNVFISLRQAQFKTSSHCGDFQATGKK
jgi:hypothetical protein